MSPSSSAYREALLDALLCVESVNNVVFLVVEPPLVSICGVVVAISPPASVTFSAFVAASRQGWADGQVSHDGSNGSKTTASFLLLREQVSW